MWHNTWTMTRHPTWTMNDEVASYVDDDMASYVDDDMAINTPNFNNFSIAIHSTLRNLLQQ
jgi:hypothetical protein